jgi:hypothetical protein
MRELIAKRPNIIPAGLGNNMSEIGMSEYLPGGPENDIDFTSFDIDAASGNLSETEIKSRSATPSRNQLDSATSDDEAKPPKKKLKGNNKALKAAEKKTAARPGISTPTTTQKGSASKAGMMVMDRFAETAKIEEETVQRQLDLKKTRVLAQVEEKKAKIGAQKDIQMARDRIKMEYRLKKEQMKMEFELRCSSLGHLSHGSQFSVPSFPASNAPGPSYSLSIAPLTPTYTERYSAASYMSWTDDHGSWANLAPSISLSFSNDNLQHSHAGSPVDGGVRGEFDFGELRYDPSSISGPTIETPDDG